MIELNKIYNEPCQVTMRRMKDRSVDLVLADFPYGKNLDYAGYDDTLENLKSLIAKVMPQILRVGRFVMITCGTDRISFYPPPDDVFCIYQPANASFSKYGHITWQPILVYGADPQVELRRKWMSIKNTEPSYSNGHPCPKPIKIWEKILWRGSANESDIVYDPLLGSGTTAAAAETG